MFKNWFSKPITSNEKLQISPEIILDPEVTKSLFDQIITKQSFKEIMDARS